MKKFQPYPEDAEVHDSFATVELDKGGSEDDHDDRQAQGVAPNPVKRLINRVVKPRG